MRRPSPHQLRAAATLLTGLAGIAMVVGSLVYLNGGFSTVSSSAEPAVSTDATSSTSSTVTTTEPATTTTTPAPDVLVDPASFGEPWGTAVMGVLTFRGNPTRSFLGKGPVPRQQPERLWRYPGLRMCGVSTEFNERRTWCGTGWTGQPAVFERDGRTWLVFGAYDYNVHFVDALTGEDIIPPFETGDLAKGNVTVDPDGYPIAYIGSRDNRLRAIAFDGDAPRELWSEDANTDDRMHNNDWDAAPLVIDGHLLAGSENSWFYGWRLDRGYDSRGMVTFGAKPEFRVKAWDQRVIDDLGRSSPQRLSIESSLAVSGDTAYFQTSGGLVQGWDLSPLRTGEGEVRRTFRFWTGDDGDATIVVDDEGFLYVGVEVDRGTSRAEELGQFMKLDPRKPMDPVVWSVQLNAGPDTGTWSTPVVLDDVVVVTTKPGGVRGFDRTTGEELWQVRVSGLTLSSPVLVDGILLQGDGKGRLHAWDLSDPRREPIELWTLDLPSNIESTPVVWNGRIYVGSRDGYMYCFGPG